MKSISSYQKQNKTKQINVNISLSPTSLASETNSSSYIWVILPLIYGIMEGIWWLGEGGLTVLYFHSTFFGLNMDSPRQPCSLKSKSNVFPETPFPRGCLASAHPSAPMGCMGTFSLPGSILLQAPAGCPWLPVMLLPH